MEHSGGNISLSRFVVFDIETTGVNYRRDKIIEIAAIKFVNMKPTDEFSTLVNPQIPLPEVVSQLTGITQEDLSEAPLWESVQQKFLDFIGDLPLVGHNLRCFDIRFINYSIGYDLKNPIIDTLDYSRHAFPDLPSHKLSYLKTALGINVEISHRALADVETTAFVLLHCLREETQPNSVVLYDCPCDSANDNHAEQFANTPRRKHISREQVKIKDITPTCECVNSSSPLCGKNIVFTGTLSIPRKDAMQLAVDAGAVLKTSVSRKTHYLVVGQQDKSIVGADGLSSKEETAIELNATGKGNIQIISEYEFIELAKKEGATV